MRASWLVVGTSPRDDATGFWLVLLAMLAPLWGTGMKVSGVGNRGKGNHELKKMRGGSQQSVE